MQALNYILLSLVSYSGLFCGILLVFIAPEEQMPGKRYFLLAQKIVLGIIIALLILNFSLINLLLSILLLVLLLFKNPNRYIVYLLFVPILYTSLSNTTFALAIPSLLFLYGMLTGSLIVKHRKFWDSIRNCLRLIYYPALSLLSFILPLISSYF